MTGRPPTSRATSRATSTISRLARPGRWQRILDAGWTQVSVVGLACVLAACAGAGDASGLGDVPIDAVALDAVTLDGGGDGGGETIDAPDLRDADAEHDLQADPSDALEPATDTDDTPGDPSDAASDLPRDAPEGIEDRAAFGPHPDALPFVYEREPVGEDVDSTVLAELTTRYLTFLDTIDYFSFVADRVHGWPESDPEGRYWYGTWWSGVRVFRQGDTITFRHSDDGADNNGLRSAQLLESACFAHALWGRESDGALVRELVRGFNSWGLAMESDSRPDVGVLLTRASYPESITAPERGREVEIDYDANHPGIDNGATSYVRIPDNPYWGELWIKNKRSKDDIGHMFRAIANLATCADGLDAATRVDIAELTRIYFAWARRVEDDRNRIATWNERLEVVFPDGDLAVYLDLPGIECPGRLLMRLAGRAYTGGIDCGDGAGAADRAMAEVRNSNAQILRSHHQAAALHALLASLPAVAEPLLRGLAERIDWFIAGFADGGRPADLEPRDFAAHILHAANAGVPLTARETTWLRAQLANAIDHYESLDPMVWDIFADGVPDGEYPYEPQGPGIFINDLGLPLGTCVSLWRNPGGAPLLDCEVVRDWYAGSSP